MKIGMPEETFQGCFLPVSSPLGEIAFSEMDVKGESGE